MSDPRYGNRRWRTVRLFVLRRDFYVCRIVDGCTERATVVDHIRPASPGMSDSLFFDPRNLRAGCRDHNLARGFASKPTVVTPAADEDVVKGDYS